MAPRARGNFPPPGLARDGGRARLLHAAAVAGVAARALHALSADGAPGIAKLARRVVDAELLEAHREAAVGPLVRAPTHGDIVAFAESGHDTSERARGRVCRAPESPDVHEHVAVALDGARVDAGAHARALERARVGRLAVDEVVVARVVREEERLGDGTLWAQRGRCAREVVGVAAAQAPQDGAWRRGHAHDVVLDEVVRVEERREGQLDIADQMGIHIATTT